MRGRRVITLVVRARGNHYAQRTLFCSRLGCQLREGGDAIRRNYLFNRPLTHFELDARGEGHYVGCEGARQSLCTTYTVLFPPWLPITGGRGCHSTKLFV